MPNYGLTNLRELFNCKKIELAQFLGLPRSLITKVEHEERRLKMDTVNFVVAIQHAIEQGKENKSINNDVDKLIQDDVKASQEKLNHQLSDARHAWHKCLLALSNMKTDFVKSAAALRHLQSTLKLTPGLSASHKDWLLTKIKLEKQKFVVNGLCAQNNLEAEARSLEARIAKINELLNTDFDILVESYTLLEKFSR